MKAHLVRPCLFLFVTILLVAAPHRSRADNETPPAISFHTVTDKMAPSAWPRSGNPTGIAYEAEPWLTDDDILTWDLSAHQLILRTDRDTVLGRFDPALVGDPFPPIPYKAFVVVADGEPCVLGSYVSVVSSFSPPGLRLGGLDLRLAPRDVLGMAPLFAGYSQLPPCLTSTLLAHGLSSGGELGVIIESIRVAVTEGPPALTVACDVVLTNDGPDDLLVLDPNLMVPGFNGYHAEFRGAFHQRLGMVDRDSPLDPTWLVRLPAGGAVRGTIVTMTRRLVSGEHSLSLMYPAVSRRSAGPHQIDGAWVGRNVGYAPETTFDVPDSGDSLFHAKLKRSQLLYVAGQWVDEVLMRYLPDGTLAVNEFVFGATDDCPEGPQCVEQAIRGFANRRSGGTRLLVVTGGGTCYRVRYIDTADAVEQIRRAQQDGEIAEGPLPAGCLEEFVR